MTQCEPGIVSAVTALALWTSIKEKALHISRAAAVAMERKSSKPNIYSADWNLYGWIEQRRFEGLPRSG